MNCIRCGAPLDAHARFCRNCGLPVSKDALAANVADPMQPYSTVSGNSSPTTQQAFRQDQQFKPPVYQSTMPVVPGSMSSRSDQNFSSSKEKSPRRRLVGCLVGGLITLIVLLVLATGAWFVGIRPYIHSLVQNQVDQVLSNAVDQIDPARAALIPPGVRIAVSERLINSLVPLNHPSSDPIQNVQVHITPAAMRMDFEVYGFSCAITGVPQMVNGQLVANNVTVEGIASLIMSPDEMTALLNQHLADAQGRLNRPIQSVSLQDQELNITFG